MDSTLLALETSSSRCSVALLRDGAHGIVVTSVEHDGDRQTHTERLLPMAHQLLHEAGLSPADLQVIAVGQGPGAFTGLRVACSVAQGIALAQGLPVVPVVSLQAIAAQLPAQADQVIVVAADARMQEVYLAVYRQVGGAGQQAQYSQQAEAERQAQSQQPQQAEQSQQAQAPLWETLQSPILLSVGEVITWVQHKLPQWEARVGLPLTLLLGGDAWEAYTENMVPPSDWQRYPGLRPRACDIACLAYQAWQRGECVPPEGVLPLYVRDHVAYTTLERSQGLGGNPPRPNMPDDSGQIVMTAMQATDLDTMVQMDAAVQTFPWTRRNFSDALAAGYDTCVLRTAQDILGFCILMHAPDVSHLLILTVAPAWQRQGLGSRLVNWCVERARTRGTQGLLVEVRPSNHAACALYTQQNFLQVGVRQAYYAAADGQREDAWVMQKSFANAPIGEH